MMRIVCCVPSLSELIFELAPEFLVGSTKFCIFPTEIQIVTLIGGTKNLQLEKIIGLHPDLVVCAKEENEKDQIEYLKRFLPVLMFDIKNIEDALEAIDSLGEFCQVTKRATEIAVKINTERTGYRPCFQKKAIYLIWQNPWMTVGGDTFINSMMKEAGFKNVFESQSRYPEIDLESAILKFRPEVILLSSEPFPFKEEHARQLGRRFPSVDTLLVDGTYFSWYGSRLMDSFSYFKTLYPAFDTQPHNNNFA